MDELINSHSPLIDASFKRWYFYYEFFCIDTSKQITELTKEVDNYDSKIEGLDIKIGDNGKEISKINIWLERIAALDEQFMLNQNVEEFENRKNDLFGKITELSELLKKTEKKDPERIQSNIKQCKNDLSDLKNKLQHVDNNIAGVLLKSFSKAELENVFKILNANILTLPENSTQDEKTLGKFVVSILCDITDNVYNGNGLRIDLSKLPLPRFDNKEELQEQITEKNSYICTLEKELEIAKVYNTKEYELAAFNKDYEFRLKEMEDLKEYVSGVKEREKKQNKLHDLQGKDQKLKTQAKELRSKDTKNRNIKTTLENELHERKRTNDELLKLESKIQTQIDDIKMPEMTNLDDIIADDDQLLGSINNFLRLENELASLKDKIDDKLEILEHEEAGKYFRNNIDDTIESLKDAIDSIPEQEELFLKSKKAALTDLGSSLKALRHNYNRLEKEIKDLNRSMNKTSISNLSKVEIEILPVANLLESIDTLIGSGGVLFSDSNDTSSAIEKLNDFVSIRANSLSLVDLFELSFAVFGADNNKTDYHDLDSIESNGTTITIKAIVNMNLMYKLLDRKNNALTNFPYYIDEAADLDPKNQKTLIDQGMQMGFIPILASVKPQPSAFYCVGLDSQEKFKHYIDKDNWVVMEPKNNE